MKKIFLLIIFIAFVSKNAFTQSVCVHEKNEARHCVPLETVQSLVFSGNDVTVKKTDKTTVVYPTDNVRKITLGADAGTSNETIPATGYELKVFPNPVGDVLTIESLVKVERIRLFDANGGLVLNETVDLEQPTIRISNLSSGIYTLEALTANGIYKKKIIKK